MFESIISTSLNFYSASICFIVSVILGLLISYTNMLTNRYSKNFSITLAILPLLVSIIIIMVNGNLGAGVAVAGAFSLIRFRSVPGNSRDIILIFFAMTIGIAIGMGYVIYSVLIAVLGCLFIYALSKTNFANKANERVLEITIPEELDYTTIFDDIFKKYLKEYKLEKVKTINLGSLFELTYRIVLNGNEKELIDDLRIRNGNLKIQLERPVDENEL